MDAGLITFQAGSSFDGAKTWHFMCLGELLQVKSRGCWVGVGVLGVLLLVGLDLRCNLASGS